MRWPTAIFCGLIYNLCLVNLSLKQTVEATRHLNSLLYFLVDYSLFLPSVVLYRSSIAITYDKEQMKMRKRTIEKSFIIAYLKRWSKKLSPKFSRNHLSRTLHHNCCCWCAALSARTVFFKINHLVKDNSLSLQKCNAKFVSL